MKQNKRSFCITIAGHIIGIYTLYEEVFDLCKDFIVDSPSEMKICIDENDILLERYESEKEHGSLSPSYLETLAVYRKISEKLLSYNTFLMHGAIIAIDNVAYMFTADSGVGKTTHVKKWLEQIENIFVVNGDKPLIRITDTQAIACGTPWCGKEKMGTNAMVPLKAIVLMERGEDNVIREISFGEAFTFLLQQTYRPADAEKMKKTLTLLMQLKRKVRFYRFRFNNMKEDTFEVAYKALIEDNVNNFIQISN